MSVLVLAGPPAVGHNTIAEALCESRDGVVIVDVDDVHDMFRGPHAAPWEAGEGERQYLASIRAACALARAFDADRYDVIVVDVAPPEVMSLYRDQLGGVSHLAVVLLIADVDVLIARDIAHDPDPRPDPVKVTAWHDRIRFLHAQLSTNTDSYDSVLDTGTQTPEQAVALLVALLGH